MHYAIIAAGEGSRLRQEGVAYDKPLVPLQGQPMIDRLISIMLRCHAESISVICNSAMPEVCRHLHAMQLGIPLHIIEAQTPSSMHSLSRLSEVIPEGKVCVTTVDTIFRERDFAAYIQAFERADHPLFVVTPFVEDEKPLWVTVEANRDRSDSMEPGSQPMPAIRAFCDEQPDTPVRYVSGGIYGLDTRTAWPVLRQCLDQGQSRMRNYQRALLAAGVPVHAWVFDCVFDVDHACDIQRAEAWLRPRRVLAVGRAAEHSPNHVANDAAILDAVTTRLCEQGFFVDRTDETVLPTLPLDRLNDYDIIVHMARRMASLSRLSLTHAWVVNAPRSVMTLAGSREYMLSMLHEAGVRVPAWWAFDPEADEMFQCDDELQQLLPGWVKATRTDGARPDDVSWVETPLEADARVIELAAQSVPDIVVTRHIEGDLLKVYCVGQRVVHSFYPQASGYSKFGTQEQHNTPLAHTPYSAEELTDLARTIARTLGLEVFGFDAIVSPDSAIHVIDVNDWPSFSACRDEAARAIADRIGQ